MIVFGLIGFVVGVVTTVAVVVFVILVSFNSSIVKDYQTLITGVGALAGAALAFLGATLTVQTIRQQIRSNEEISEKRRQRQSIAARSVLPNALSRFCSYGRESAEFMGKIRTAADEAEILEIPAPPEKPEDAIAIFRDCIEHADQEVAENMANLLKDLQIQNSRMIGTYLEIQRGDHDFNHFQRNDMLDEYILNTLEIYARASSLYEYARREEDGAPGEIDYGNLTNAGYICQITREEFPGVYEIMELLYPPID